MRAHRKRILFRVTLVILLALIATGFAVGHWFRVRTESIRLGLPTPLRLAVLSDFHLGARGSEDMARRAVREAIKRRPDAIVLVGDFVASADAISRIPATFGRLRAPLGVYAALGNHDHWAGTPKVVAALQSAGIRVLVNRSAVVRTGRTRLAFVGIDDLWTSEADWQAAWRGVPKTVPVVLLSHNPDAALTPEGRRASLIVCGHTHAGKFNLPLVVHRFLRRVTGRGLIPRSDYGISHPYGLFHESWGWVYVTSGVATGYSPPRWFTRPELAILDLR